MKNLRKKIIKLVSYIIAKITKIIKQFYKKIKNGYIQARTDSMPEFKCYYPSKADMNRKQLKYYKFWKKRWNKGEAIKADKSYLFVYIYRLINKSIKEERGTKSLEELERIKNNYKDQVGKYLEIWISDLLEYHGYYLEALEMINNCNDLKSNKILNLKFKINKEINGKDLLRISRNFGLYLPKALKNNFEEAVALHDEKIDEFKNKNQQSIFSFLKNKEINLSFYNDEAYILSGVPNCHAGVERFNFLNIYFLVNFSIETTKQVILELNEKYAKRKTSYEIKNKIKKKLWELQIKKPFKNPNYQKNENGCGHKFLRLKNHWETSRKYECLICHKLFRCSCEKEIIGNKKESANWLKGICPKCRGFEDTSFITEGKLMYGSTFYAKHWREINFETIRLKKKKEVSKEELKELRKEAENNIREKYDIPLIGEKWVSETELYRTVNEALEDYEVVHHGNPDWLGRMHLDVYIPELKVAFEYQGKQHEKPVDFFGGRETFKKQKKRDEKKRKLCKKHEVKLFYIQSGENFSKKSIHNLVKDHL